jgi:hypothetical protein
MHNATGRFHLYLEPRGCPSKCRLLQKKLEVTHVTQHRHLRSPPHVDPEAGWTFPAAFKTTPNQPAGILQAAKLSYPAATRGGKLKAESWRIMWLA